MQSRPIQPHAEARDELELSEDEARLLKLLADRYSVNEFVEVDGSHAALRRLRQIELIDLLIDTKGRACARLTRAGMRSVTRALAVIAASGAMAR